jgi:hypothetical protein
MKITLSLSLEQYSSIRHSLYMRTVELKAKQEVCETLPKEFYQKDIDNAEKALAEFEAIYAAGSSTL